MATKKCIKCEEERGFAHFINVNSPFFKNSMPICRKCLSDMIAAAYEKNEGWNFVDKLCQWIDIPFLPEEWEKFYQVNGADGFGQYVALFRSEQYNGLHWQDYNKVYLELKEEGRIEDALPEIKEKRLRDLRNKWGPDYDEQDLVYLENLHLGILESQNVIGALNEDQALKLCKISLIIEEKIRAGQDFSKDIKAYDDLAKLSNFTPKAVKDAEEFESFGEVGSYLEKTGFVCSYCTDVDRDEVDFTIRNMKKWSRYLYTNENGIAEEIEERIQNLRIADKIQGSTGISDEEYAEYNAAALKEEEKEEFSFDV